MAQGVLAFFSAQTYVKQAEEAIKLANEAVAQAKESGEKAKRLADDAVARIDALAGDVKSRYPMFADIESARADAFRELSSLAPSLDEDQNLYAGCSPMVRQEVYAIESFSAIQFLAPASRSAELLRNIRLLGKFYAGKFAAEHQLRSDFERSQYYLELALSKFGRNFTVLNDMGWLFSTIADPIDNKRAQSFFEESLRLKPHQQQALYNLGTILVERGDRVKLEEAKSLLLRAKEEHNWEEAPPNPKSLGHLSYNLACAYDGLAALDGSAREDLLDECMKHLKAAAAIGSQSRALVEYDVGCGDLSLLGKSRRHSYQLLEVFRTYYKVGWIP